MPQILHALGVYGAEFNRKGRDYVAAHPAAGNLGGGGGEPYGAVITVGGNGGRYGFEEWHVVRRTTMNGAQP